MKMSSTIEKLAEALAASQKEFPSIPCTAENPFYKSRYAPMNKIIERVAPILGKNGLSVLQPVSTTDSAVCVETMLIHSSGQWIRETLFLKPTKTDPQGIGSAITYGRRYGLSAMLNIASDSDDDENGVSEVLGKKTGNVLPAKTDTKKTPDKTPLENIVESKETLSHYMVEVGEQVDIVGLYKIYDKYKDDFSSLTEGDRKEAKVIFQAKEKEIRAKETK